MHHVVIIGNCRIYIVVELSKYCSGCSHSNLLFNFAESRQFLKKQLRIFG